MKKLVAILMVVGICVSFSQAQAAQFTLRPMFGYGLSTGKIAGGTDEVYDGTKTTKNETYYYSAGGGIKFGLGLDIEVAEHVALGLDFGYSLGSKAEVDKYTGPTDNRLTEYQSSYLPISLTLKVKSKLEKMTLYAGMGPSMLMAAKSTVTETRSGTGYNIEEEGDITYKMGLGYHGLLGVEYGISEKMDFVAQLRTDQIALKSDKYEMTKATLDGKDVLGTYDVRDKNITYEEDDTADDYTKADVPEIQNAFIMPANNFTLNIGIAYKF
ncbi:MAG: PorT family protein [Methanosarcinaceae archaeon]|nr:PorT family protein [Methanosarcinaceae archaeon]